MRLRLIVAALPLIALAWASVPAEAQDTYQTPPASLARLVDAPLTPGVSLSPIGESLVLMRRPSLSSISRLAAPELRLAGIRINPRNSGPSRAAYFEGLTLTDLEGNARDITGVPEDGGIRSVRWAPDGRHLAFTVDHEDRIDLYVASVSDASARRVLDAAVNDVARGAPFSWIDEASLVVLTVPAERGAAPEAPAAPSGPIIQETTGEAAPARTYQDLLKSPHDEALFSHYLTSVPVRLSLAGDATTLGEPALYTSVDPSPNGDYVLVERVHEPFSYLVPVSRFPETTEVWDASGTRVARVAELPLAEGVPTAFGSVRSGARSVSWRADEGAALYWVEALDGGDARAEADFRDKVLMLPAPFDAEPTELMRLPLRYAGVQWGDGVALVREVWFSTRVRRAYVVDPDRPGDARVLLDVSMEDRYADPGSPATRATPQGTRVLHMVGGGVFMVGRGASPEGNRPFLRRMDLASGETQELFRSEAPYYESPVSILDDDGTMLLTVRESTDEPPNYYVRDLEAGSIRPITDFPHPYPALAKIEKRSLQYEREDGVALTATLYLPAGYDAAEDGPLPAFVWAYPREFKNADFASQRSDSPFQFKRVSYWGAVPYVTQGYAVLDNAAMPVVGEGDEEPNDSFREQLVMNARAAIQEGVRQGVVDPDRVAIGGHSYGAFMTANLLAHSDLFRAGVARSGAYNRTLTPFGFQREERSFWEAPEIYFAMSPFMHAEKVDEPILLIHGQADNNSGTFPIQSERFYAALKGLGATARLVLLPHESHGYRARESIMHMLWETNRWLDLHVKNAEPRDGRVTQEEAQVSGDAPTLQPEKR